MEPTEPEIENALDDGQDEELNFILWVDSTLRLMESPASNTGVFCAQWWRHPEAMYRLKALYTEYRQAQGNDGMSGWWVYHWDAHRRALCDPEVGVFRDCSAGHDPGRSKRIMDVADVLADVVDDEDASPYWM